MSKLNEQGRTMVEMLGSLAIMVILTAVGFKLFNLVLNRFYANELLSEAMKHASKTAIHLAADKEDLFIGKTTTLPGYVFGIERDPTDTDRFNITIDYVKGEVCDQMKAATDLDSIIRIISDDCTKLTFNNDLSTTIRARDFNGNATACTSAGKAWCGGSGLCLEENNCCEGKQSDPCLVCSKGELVSGPTENKKCTYQENDTNKTGVCHLGRCQALPSTMSCSDSSCQCTNGGQLCNRSTGECCTSTQMCNSSGDVVSATNDTYKPKCVTLEASGSECTTNAQCLTKYPTGNKPWCKITATSDCYTPTKGTCTALGNVALTASVYGLGEIIVSSTTANWWSAKNWCEAKGMKLLNVEDFQVYKSNGQLLSTGDNAAVYACAKGKTCSAWNATPYSNMWEAVTGNTTAARSVTNARDAKGERYVDKYSPVVVDLAKLLKGSRNTVWTNSDSAKNSSCNAYFVYLLNGRVYGAAHTYAYSIVCHAP